LESKIRRKLGFIEEDSNYIPTEFKEFTNQLSECDIPEWKGFYKVMNRVWQDVCTTGIKYMEESQVQDVTISFMYHTLMHLISRIRRWRLILN
jgi:hypothetical protein